MNRSSTRRDTRVTAIVFVGFLVAALAPSASLGGQAPPQDVTFTDNIAPILQRSCESCHRTNGVAPMPLTTYKHVRPWATAIKRATAKREMPPWFIEKNIGIQRFIDDPSLSDEEIATIAAWVDSGAPRGNPSDMPPPRTYADASGWTIGTPDLVVSTPVMTVRARAADWHGEVGPVPIGLKRFSDSPCTAWARRGTSACTNAGGPMQAYSMDLRERALLDSDAGMKAADVAVKYRVSGSWVRLLKQRRRETGEVAPRVQRHGRRRMLEPHLHTLAALIAEQPDRTLAELKDALGTPASLATIWRAVAALDVTVKKNGPALRTRST